MLLVNYSFKYIYFGMGCLLQDIQLNKEREILYFVWDQLNDIRVN